MTSATDQSTTIITNLPAPPYNTQWIDSKGQPTRIFRSFLDLLYQRIGGASGDVIYTASDFSNADAASANQIYAAFQENLDYTNQVVFSINEQTQDTVQQWIDDSQIGATTQLMLDTPAGQIVVTATTTNATYYPVLASVDTGNVKPATSDALIYNPSTGLLTTTHVTASTLTSTVASGTAPFTVTSTTNVPHLNASSLNGATFAAPGSIGSTTASSGAFSTFGCNGQSPQAAYSHTTSGTAPTEPVLTQTTPYGFNSPSALDALYAQVAVLTTAVAALNAALVANGIMS